MNHRLSGLEGIVISSDSNTLGDTARRMESICPAHPGRGPRGRREVGQVQRELMFPVGLGSGGYRERTRADVLCKGPESTCVRRC